LREIKYKMEKKEKDGKKEVDRRGYKLIQVNSLAMDKGDDEEGKPIIILLVHSDKEKITGIIGVDTEVEIINAISSLLNGWIVLNKKRFEEGGKW
jgi:hypothetical protein